MYLALSVFILSSCGPTSKFTFDQEKPKAPSTIKFANESKKAESYEWDFGDGEKSMEANPSHNYYLSGKYQVKLKAKKKNRTRTSIQEIYIDAPDKCLVILQTEFGNMLMELYDDTPQHRDNFIKLAESGFYNDLLFHRIISGFMIQGGDPDSKNAAAGKALGGGGPGYMVPAEMNKKHVHIRGAIAAARTPDNVNPEKKSSGSQFYIVHGNPVPENQLRNFELMKGLTYTDEQKEIFMNQGGTPFLDMEYTVFGKVIDGIEIIDIIANAKKDGRDRPLEDIKMTIKVIK